MTSLLEYNDEFFQFHRNELRHDNRRFSSDLFDNGWRPVCIVEDQLYNNADFQMLLTKITEDRMGWYEVYTFVNMWVINWKEYNRDLCRKLAR